VRNNPDNEPVSIHYCFYTNPLRKSVHLVKTDQGPYYNSHSPQASDDTRSQFIGMSNIERLLAVNLYRSLVRDDKYITRNVPCPPEY